MPSVQGLHAVDVPRPLHIVVPLDRWTVDALHLAV